MDPRRVSSVITLIAVRVASRQDPLNALAGIDLARVDHALRIDIEDVDPVELARVPAVVTELAGDLAGQTAHLIDVVVLSVGDVEEVTVAIERGRDVPHRPIAECLGLLEELLHELS